jgi:molecular chaperone Hsp33
MAEIIELLAAGRSSPSGDGLKTGGAKTRPRDRWIKCISTHGNLRGVAIQAPGLIQEMCDRHKLGETGRRALGESVVGALLVASYCKDGERVNLNIQGSGVCSQALVEAHPNGTVRGYVVETDRAGGGGSTSEGPWGSGLLSVLRTKDQEGEQPYIGTVPLLTGHLAKDLTYYWAQSEQVPSALGIAVYMKGTRVTEAGGFLVQAMPGATTEEVRSLERHINEIHSLAGRLTDDADPALLLSQIFQDTSFVLLEEKPLRFQCTCSWERVVRALTLIGTSELQSMLAEDDAASVRCDFCGEEYKVDHAALQKLIDEASTTQ